MNYYQHHISDFNNATIYLSRIERSIYREMLDLYYDTEKALPSDIEMLKKRLRIADESEEKALIFVLSEYFQKEEDGYHHHRCDSEIQKYHEFLDKQKENGRLGGRPKKTQAFQVGSQNKTQKKPNHYPLTTIQTNQKENIKEKVLDSRNSLTPCTESELIELSIKRKVTLTQVRRTHEILLNHIADGNAKKYKTLFRTLDNWLIMGLQRGTLQEAPTSMLPQTKSHDSARPLTPSEEENIKIMEAGIQRSEPTVNVTGLLSDFRSSFKTV